MLTHEPGPGTAEGRRVARITHALGDCGLLDRCWDYADGRLQWVRVPASSHGAVVLMGRRYADNLFILRHRDLSASRDLAIGGVSEQDDDGLLRRPDGRVRDIINPLWNARASAQYRDGIRAIARACASKIRGAGVIDLASAFAVPFVHAVTAYLCGLEDGEAAGLQRLSDRTTGTLLYAPGDHLTAYGAWADLYEYSRPLIRRARKGGDSLMSRTIRRMDDAGIPPAEVERTIPTGHNGFGTMYPTLLRILIRLLASPHLLEQCRAQPAAIPAVMRDIMISDAHFTFGLPGLLTKAMRSGGRVVPAGTPVFPNIHAAHMDPSRPPRGHLGWGSGPHGCLGQWVGRIALEEAVCAAAGLPGLGPAGDDWLPRAWPAGTMPVPLYVLAAA
jgi:cytochrome P450